MPRIATLPFTNTIFIPPTLTYDTTTGVVTITLEALATAIATALSATLPQLRVYVLESDITRAQNSVRTVVEEANIQ